MRNLIGDIQYALRQFRLSPVFALTAVLTLAIGIGGTTAIFSLIHAVMLRSLPVANPSTLYRVGDGNTCCVEGSMQDNWGMFTYQFYQRLLEDAPEFAELTAFQSSAARFSVRRVSTERIARPLRGEYVAGNYFATFGIRSFAGRVLKPSDDQPSANPVVVISYHSWQDNYSGDPAIVGSQVVVEDKPFTIIGIAPPGFFGETLRNNPPDLWIPLQQEPMIAGSGTLLRQSVSSWLRIIGRLRPNATTAGLSARFTTLLRSFLRNNASYPAAWMPQIVKLLPKQVVHVVPAGGGVEAMKEDYKTSLQILLSVCSLVLLIACANVANLMLARFMSRRGQTALRIAMGASRGRILMQSLTESVLLAIIGGIAGLFVASAAGHLLLNLAFHNDGFLTVQADISLPVLAFSFGLSLFTGVLFGTAPAFFATRADPVEALRGANRSTRDTSSWSRQALLVVQATLSVVLIAGAVMLTRSLNNLSSQDIGYQPENRVLVNLNSPPPTYTPQRLNALYRDLEQRLNSTPGIQQAGLALYNPFTDNFGELIYVQGHPPINITENSGSSWDRVDPTYLPALGQTLLRGRGFTAADNEHAQSVAIVNEAFVERFFPHEDALDKHFGLDLPENAGTYRIIGIVRSAKYTDIRSEVYPMFFVPLAQSVTYSSPLLQMVESRTHFIGGALLVTKMKPGAIEPIIKKILSDVDPNLTVINVRSLADQVALELDQERAVAGLAGLFGTVALLLAAIGLYGVTAYAVAQRTSEIGIRMALGARRASVMKLVLRNAFQKVLIGLALGVPLAIGAGKLISSKLYNVAIWDPVALSLAVLLLAFSALLAAIIPATRAASIDPMKALRTE